MIFSSNITFFKIQEWVELDMDEPNATLEDHSIGDGSVVTFEEKKIKKG